ncbi:MAG: hypothetical protein KDK70_15165, partial [Myxococcales bacterium]|nr:hypothetical protein [Myxococcales bacterium]
MPLLLVPLWLASVGLGPSALAPGEVDAVELPWARYQELRAAADEPGPEPGPWVAERDVRLRPIEGGWDLEVRWTVHAETAGLLAGELLGPGIQLRHATLGGKPAPAVSLPGGATVLAAWIEGG